MEKLISDMEKVSLETLARIARMVKEDLERQDAKTKEEKRLKDKEAARLYCLRHYIVDFTGSCRQRRR